MAMWLLFPKTEGQTLYLPVETTDDTEERGRLSVAPADIYYAISTSPGTRFCLLYTSDAADE